MLSTVTTLEVIGTLLFAAAVVHTFCAGFFQKLADKYPSGSVKENLFHLLGEVEAVFALWAAVFIGVFSLIHGYAITEPPQRLVGGALHYLESLNFTEPVFVFVIMCAAGTRPVIYFAEKIIFLISRSLPLSPRMAFYISVLIAGPLLGSLITEPAAMTVTALILLEYFYSHTMTTKFKYATLGLLFVNVSVGGTLTSFAAPPVLMVAGRWGWDMPFMLSHFGFKAVVAVVASTLLTAFYFKKELAGPVPVPSSSKRKMVPRWWIVLTHMLFLAAIVFNAHHVVAFTGIFLLFVGFTAVTSEYQNQLKLKESLLVATFLAGLVVLGGMQGWWLKDLLANMSDITLYFGATSLTAVTDNAALTYLGSLVELSDSAKYNLVAGAVTGGGLTVIANAPNPAGYGILKNRFQAGTINAFYLFAGALIPTFIAILCFLLIPHF